MDLPAVYRFAAVVTWTLTVTFLLVGLGAVGGSDLYAVAALSGLAAVTTTVLSAFEGMVGRAVAREGALSWQLLAQAIAEALADELDKRRERGDLTLVAP